MCDCRWRAKCNSRGDGGHLCKYIMEGGRKTYIYIYIEISGAVQREVYPRSLGKAREQKAPSREPWLQKLRWRLLQTSRNWSLQLSLLSAWRRLQISRQFLHLSPESLHNSLECTYFAHGASLINSIQLYTILYPSHSRSRGKIKTSENTGLNRSVCVHFNVGLCGSFYFRCIFWACDPIHVRFLMFFLAKNSSNGLGSHGMPWNQSDFTPPEASAGPVLAAAIAPSVASKSYSWRWCNPKQQLATGSKPSAIVCGWIVVSNMSASFQPQIEHMRPHVAVVNWKHLSL